MPCVQGRLTRPTGLSPGKAHLGCCFTMLVEAGAGAQGKERTVVASEQGEAKWETTGVPWWWLR